MVEYGRGHYDAFQDGGTSGSGGSRYVGGGIVFRTRMKDSDFFYEGSLRAGRLRTNYATDSPTLKGNSGMVEFGYVIKPKGRDNLSFDISGSYWFGRQRGLTGRVGVNWIF